MIKNNLLIANGFIQVPRTEAEPVISALWMIDPAQARNFDGFNLLKKVIINEKRSGSKTSTSRVAFKPSEFKFTRRPASAQRQARGKTLTISYNELSLVADFIEPPTGRKRGENEDGEGLNRITNLVTPAETFSFDQLPPLADLLEASASRKRKAFDELLPLADLLELQLIEREEQVG